MRLFVLLVLLNTVQAAIIPKQGECYLNHVNGDRIFTIADGDTFIASSYYNHQGMIGGFFLISKNSLKDQLNYTLVKEECPRFILLDGRTTETVKDMKLDKEFIRAVCKSRIVNRARNREACQGVR